MKIALILTLFISHTAFAYSEKLDKIPAEDRKIVDQLKFEKGGHIVFEQYLEKKEKYNGQDSYRLELICDKQQPKKEASCKVISYEVLKKEVR